MAYARDRSDTVDEFKRNLELEGVTLKETVKTDKKTGEVTAGWSYKAVDEWGPKRRSPQAPRLQPRRRPDQGRASRPTSRRSRGRRRPRRKTRRHLFPVATVAAEPQPDSPAEPSFDVYAVEESDVAQMAGDLQRAHIDRCRESGEPFMGERYEQLMEAERHPEEQLAKLRGEVDAARREFHDSKEARDALNHPCPNLLAGAWVFAKAGRDAKDPVSRMMADMTAMMLRMLLQQGHGGAAPPGARSCGEASVRVPQEHVGRREAPEVSREGPCPTRTSARSRQKRVRLQEREDKAVRGAPVGPREVRGRCGQAVRVAEKDKGGSVSCLPFLWVSGFPARAGLSSLCP